MALLNTISGCIADFSFALSSGGLYQDTAGATPVTAGGQTVALIQGLSGNGETASQATSGDRGTYNAAINGLNGLDGITLSGSNYYTTNITYNAALGYTIIAVLNPTTLTSGGNYCQVSQANGTGTGRELLAMAGTSAGTDPGKWYTAINGTVLAGTTVQPANYLTFPGASYDPATGGGTAYNWNYGVSQASYGSLSGGVVAALVAGTYSPIRVRPACLSGRPGG